MGIIPSINSLKKFITIPLTDQDWLFNFNKIISWITDGTTDLKINSITANTFNGLPSFQITGLLAGENLTAGNYVVQHSADGKVYKADNTTLIGVTNLLGIITVSASTGDTVFIETRFYNTATILTARSGYYVGTNGSITPSIPASNIRLIGIATTTTSIQLLPAAYDSYRNLSTGAIDFLGEPINPGKISTTTVTTSSDISEGYSGGIANTYIHSSRNDNLDGSRTLNLTLNDTHTAGILLIATAKVGDATKGTSIVSAVTFASGTYVRTSIATNNATGGGISISIDNSSGTTITLTNNEAFAIKVQMSYIGLGGAFNI